MSVRTQAYAATIIGLRCVKYESEAVLLVLGIVELNTAQIKTITSFG